MITRQWPGWFRALYGNKWPDSYLCLDTETTGFSKDKDVIIEFGHCLVEDGKVVDRLNVVLDWSGHPIVSDDYIKNKIQHVKDSMARDGRVWGMSYKRMREEGINPEKALTFYRDLLKSWADGGGLFVTHNGFFDETMLSYNFAGFKIDPEGFLFPEDQYFDTASMEKATQLIADPRSMPIEGESLKVYFKRLKYMRGNEVLCNLDKHCVPKYQLCEKYDLRPEDLHTADGDAYACHLLMKEFGRLQVEPEPHTKAKMPELFKHSANQEALPDYRPPVFGNSIRRRGQRNR